MKIYDATVESSDGNHQSVDADALSLIWIHRIGIGAGTTAAEISRFFQTHPDAREITGGNMAYTLVGTPDRVELALPLDERAAHARRWGNAWGIGFAQVGDFNRHPPPSDMWNRAVDTCAALCLWLAPHTPKMLSLLPRPLRTEIPVVGHGEVPAAYSKRSGKRQPGGSDACPGRLWDMGEFRQDVLRVKKDMSARRLVEMGIRFHHGQ
jgi:hypothetical protein